MDGGRGGGEGAEGGGSGDGGEDGEAGGKNPTSEKHVYLSYSPLGFLVDATV